MTTNTIAEQVTAAADAIVKREGAEAAYVRLVGKALAASRRDAAPSMAAAVLSRGQSSREVAEATGLGKGTAGRYIALGTALLALPAKARTATYVETLAAAMGTTETDGLESQRAILKALESLEGDVTPVRVATVMKATLADKRAAAEAKRAEAEGSTSEDDGAEAEGSASEASPLDDLDRATDALGHALNRVNAGKALAAEAERANTALALAEARVAALREALAKGARTAA